MSTASSSCLEQSVSVLQVGAEEVRARELADAFLVDCHF